MSSTRRKTLRSIPALRTAKGDTVGGELGLGAASNKNAGTLAGDKYASHYVFSDPAFTRRIQGWAQFDADIVTVFTQTSTLNASDVFLNNGVNYEEPILRGLENGDYIDVVGDAVWVDFTAKSPGDFIRVLTLESSGAAVLEPSIIGLFAAGLAGLGFAYRRRNHQS